MNNSTNNYIKCNYIEHVSPNDLYNSLFVVLSYIFGGRKHICSDTGWVSGFHSNGLAQDFRLLPESTFSLKCNSVIYYIFRFDKSQFSSQGSAKSILLFFLPVCPHQSLCKHPRNPGVLPLFCLNRPGFLLRLSS